MPNLHVCVVLTSIVNENIDNVLEQLTGKLFDSDISVSTWSIILLNREESTIFSLQKIVGKKPNCSNNVFELSHFSDIWSDEQITNEVLKLLPRRVIMNKMNIVIDKHTIKRDIYASHRTIK